jgi:hypothetical protein
MTSTSDDPPLNDAVGVEFIRSTQGLCIVFSPQAQTLVPYGPADRPDGNRNHGWTDLRGRPDLVETVPEISKSAGLRRVLTALAQPGSDLFSFGCECAAFHQPGQLDPPWHVGGFIDVTFSDPVRASDRAQLLLAAEEIADGLRIKADHICTFELIVEPLRTYFGRSDCFQLELKPHGHADNEKSAWEAFEVAATAIADAIVRRRG